MQEDSVKTNCTNNLEIEKNVYDPLSKLFISSFYYFKCDIGTICDKKDWKDQTSSSQTNALLLYLIKKENGFVVDILYLMTSFNYI